MNIAANGSSVRQLSMSEIDEVSGGLAPLVVVGLCAGAFVGGALTAAAMYAIAEAVID